MPSIIASQRGILGNRINETSAKFVNTVRLVERHSKNWKSPFSVCIFFKMLNMDHVYVPEIPLSGIPPNNW